MTHPKPEVGKLYVSKLGIFCLVTFAGYRQNGKHRHQRIEALCNEKRSVWEGDEENNIFEFFLSFLKR